MTANVYIYNMETRYVYALINPLNGHLFYVGETKDLQKRLWQHVRPSGTGQVEKDEIIKAIRAAGRKPLIEILWSKTCEIKEAQEKETFFIRKLSINNVLTNQNGGGNKPPSRKDRCHRPETKALMFASSPHKKTVVQVTKTGEIVATFEGVRQACRETGIDHRSIAQVAAGSLIRKTAGGYVWKYI